jgi:hypothetical protein
LAGQLDCERRESENFFGRTIQVFPLQTLEISTSSSPQWSLIVRVASEICLRKAVQTPKDNALKETGIYRAN